jgi:hypothetical protein
MRKESIMFKCYLLSMRKESIMFHEKGEHNVRMLLLLSYISEISKISALHK